MLYKFPLTSGNVTRFVVVFNLVLLLALGAVVHNSVSAWIAEKRYAMADLARDMQKRISEETHHALSELSTNAGYPISETLSGSGDLGQVLVDAIKKYDVDLVLCGHHQDFWSKLMSSARQLINTVHIDMLIVPLRDEEEE